MTSDRNRPQAESQYPQSELKGTVTVIGDIVKPALPEFWWDSLEGASSPTVGAVDDYPTSRQAPRGGGK